jgi:hypothetical protein
MTNEPADAVQEADWLVSPVRARDDELRHSAQTDGLNLAQVALVFAAANFCSAFLQALGQRAENSMADLPKRAAELMRKHVQRKGKPDEIHIGLEDDAAATVIVTADLPDEARLALLDLDVTAPHLRGQELRWDPATGEWLPSEPTGHS